MSVRMRHSRNSQQRHMTSAGKARLQEGAISKNPTWESPTWANNKEGPHMRKLMKWTMKWTVVVMALSLIAAACGDDDDGEATPATPTTEAAEPVETPEPAPEEVTRLFSLKWGVGLA